MTNLIQFTAVRKTSPKCRESPLANIFSNLIAAKKNIPKLRDPSFLKFSVYSTQWNIHKEFFWPLQKASKGIGGPHQLLVLYHAVFFLYLKKPLYFFFSILSIFALKMNASAAASSSFSFPPVWPTEAHFEFGAISHQTYENITIFFHFQ